MSFHEAAPAKINLALHVRRRRADGYHDIETIFAFAEDGDLLSAETRDDGSLSLHVSGTFATDLQANDNLVLDAAQRLQATGAIPQGAKLWLDKRLPVAAGLGGGSADAAAALRLLDRLWALGRTETELLDIAASLGADVPACLLGRPMRGDGRGDCLSPLRGIDLLRAAPFLLLANPRVAVSTPAVFAAWDGLDRGPLDADGGPEAWRNDLEAPAIAQEPVIAEVLTLLAGAAGRGLARMSGSGATGFATFARADDRDRALARLRDLRPSWWFLATRFAQGD